VEIVCTSFKPMVVFMLQGPIVVAVVPVLMVAGMMSGNTSLSEQGP